MYTLSRCFINLLPISAITLSRGRFIRRALVIELAPQGVVLMDTEIETDAFPAPILLSDFDMS
ncbi:hypothetical protein JZ751_007112 [Albula glossodonta]|uniref:Uncharacterized protein n=1 Tax=Albula glossodonta TaxID=121402 RepID=A0A8T2P086_9TELE|nr:hypothetical protein JZ751_007112 [Albula glossodonta]